MLKKKISPTKENTRNRFQMNIESQECVPVYLELEAKSHHLKSSLPKRMNLEIDVRPNLPRKARKSMAT